MKHKYDMIDMFFNILINRENHLKNLVGAKLQKYFEWFNTPIEKIQQSYLYIMGLTKYEDPRSSVTRLLLLT